MPKVQLIDRVGNGGATGISISYFVLLAIWLIAGSRGPSPMEGFSPSTVTASSLVPVATSLLCVDPTVCNVQWMGEWTATKQNQNLQLTMTVQRPLQPNNVSFGLSQAFAYQQTYTLDVWQNGAPIVTNVSHVASMYCPAKEATCSMSSTCIGGLSASGCVPSVLTMSFISGGTYE